MLEELKEQYRQTLPEKAAAMRDLLKDLQSGNAGAIEKARLIAHTLYGSGSTFGFPAISSAARTAELADGGELPKALANLIDVLEAAFGVQPITQYKPILVIDDDNDITRLLQALLHQKLPERQVFVAASAAEAITWINTHDFALIVLDLLLPDIDGRQLLKELRGGRQQKTPVFVLSGVDKQSVRDECFALGATRVYAKPFDPDAMAASIAAAVQSPPVTAAAATAAEAKPAAAKPLLPVLVAEDDDLLVNVIRHRLGREGMQIEHANNGAAATVALEQRAFSLVILDVKMPMMDGFEVLTRLRQRFDKKTLPVIMLTAMGSEKDVVRAYDLGANDYVLKPFSPVELLAKVKNHLRLE